MEIAPDLAPGSPGDEGEAGGIGPDPSGPSSDEGTTGAAGCIVVADDNEDCRMALRALLEALGHEVHEAVDGEEAVEVSRRVRPDLVLMDIMMPGVDGLEATRRIRDIHGLGGVRIVAVTAMEGAREASMAAGCDDCIVKPVDLDGLDELVDGWIDGS
jgi:two-component system cell cycle response regulator DivK